MKYFFPHLTIFSNIFEFHAVDYSDLGKNQGNLNCSKSISVYLTDNTKRNKNYFTKFRGHPNWTKSNDIRQGEPYC